MNTHQSSAAGTKFKSVLVLERPASRYNNDLPSYRHEEWKVQPRSVFEYDPIEEGIESVSLGFLRNQTDKTVYEGYGKQDYYQRCCRKVKGIDPKPAISWVHGGQTRWSNAARLADATSKFPEASVKINGVPVSVEEILASYQKSASESHYTEISSNQNHRDFQTSTVHSKQVEDYSEEAVSSTEHHHDEILRSESADFVELPPRLLPLSLSKAGVYTPAPFQAPPLQVNQPLFKNFNRSPTPFSASRQKRL